MPKKKKKSRASTGGNNNNSNSEATPSKSSQPKNDSTNRRHVSDSVTLHIVRSSNPPVKKGLKYTPMIVMNEVDAERLDVIAGDHVFLLMMIKKESAIVATTTTTTTTGPSETSSNFELVKTALARVHVATNQSSGSRFGSPPIKSPSTPSSSASSGGRISRSRLSSGYCNIFPVVLSDAFLEATPTSTTFESNKSKPDDSSSATSSASPTISNLTTPKKTASTDNSTTTPMKTPSTGAIATPSPSKSKFSFAKGGGGDALISPSSIQKKKNRTTPTSASARSMSTSTSTLLRKLWVVPLESTLGDYIASTLCRTAASIAVRDSRTAKYDDDGTDLVAATETETSASASSQPPLSGMLGKRLVLAHISGAYMCQDEIFPLSFQGLMRLCHIANIEETVEVDQIVKGFENLSLESPKDSNGGEDDGNDDKKTADDSGKSELLESLAMMGKKTEKVKKLRLYKVNSTMTTVNFYDEEKGNSHHGKSEKIDNESNNDNNNAPATFVTGLDRVIEEVEDLLEGPMFHPEIYIDKRLKPPKGVLLHGPSGSGKSSLALQIGQKLSFKRHVYVEHVHCTSLQSQTAFVGRAEASLVELYESAKIPRPGKVAALMILDDVHLICPRREGINAGADRLASTLLALMDGIDTDEDSAGDTPSSSTKSDSKKAMKKDTTYPFMILAITTNPSSLDPALRRPGRLDSEVEVPLPDEPATRTSILRFHMKTLNVPASLSEEEWSKMGRLAKGFTGADLKLAAKEAIRHTVLDVPPTSTDKVSVGATTGEMTLHVTADALEKAIRCTKPSAIKAVTVEIPHVPWSAIGGMEEVKRQLREAIEFPMTHRVMFQKLGIRPPKGVLLYGPPGCSKTLMARALATEGNMNFLAVKGPELLSKWLGESERALASLFRRARLASPSVIFFDEVDSIASKRGESSSAAGGERLLSQLLTELDGIRGGGNNHGNDNSATTGDKRVVVVCATNRPDLLDRALVRPGRIDRMIYVGLPDKDSRLRILEIGLKNKACADDLDFPRLSQDDVSGGLSGAELIAACRDAALLTLEEDAKLKSNEESAPASTTRTTTTTKDDISSPVIRMDHILQALTSMERQITQEMLDFYDSFKQKRQA